MRQPVFTAEWARALGDALGSSPAYRRSAQGWEGSLALVLDPENDVERAPTVFLDLRHGECHAARLATDADREASRYMVVADARTWRQLLNGELGLETALFGGKLRLERGRLLDLVPHLEGVLELFAIARSLGSDE